MFRRQGRRHAERRNTDAAWRKNRAETGRDPAAPIDARPHAIYKRVRVRLEAKACSCAARPTLRIPGFNGAGSRHRGQRRGKKQIGLAIKTVWASLWNLPSRSAFGIDHRQVYAGVFIQVGQRHRRRRAHHANLFDPGDDNASMINAKWGLGLRSSKFNVPSRSSRHQQLRHRISFA